MTVNVEKLLKIVENGDFSKFVKKWWNVENVDGNIKTIFCTDLLLHSEY